MTRLVLPVALAAGSLFLVLALRLRTRVGPRAGALQAVLLALFLSLLGAFVALRIAGKPDEAVPQLIVLADASTAAAAPEEIRRELARVPQGALVRFALYEPAEEVVLSPAVSSPGAGPRPEARFSSLDAALGWAALEAQGDSAGPDVLVLSHRPEDPRSPSGLETVAVRVTLPQRRDRISSLRLPPRVFAGRPLSLRATVRAPAEPWEARVVSGGRTLATRTGTGRPEETVEVAFSLPAGRAGTHRVVLELLDAQGVVIDREYGDCTVLPPPRLAYVGPPGGRSPLARRLAAAGYDLRDADLAQLAATPSGDGALIAILEDVPASRLNWPVVSALARSVSAGDRGLLFVGGPRSFTAGGYRDAPVERLLPLSMGLRDPRQEKHRTALVIVLDTSWSMLCPPEGCAHDSERMFGSGVREARGPRVRKIDLARQALLELLPAMREVDSFGILGVRTAPYWELEPGVLADLADVEERVRRIAPGGSGILLYSALLEASQRLTAIDAEVRHLLVLLDTDDIDEIRVLGVGTVEELVADLARKHVSVSFVGFGFSDDRYVPLLHRLASSTGGGLYLSSDVASIPRFLQEDREGLAGRQTLRRRLATRHDEDALPGPAATPPVEGIFITEAKPDARTLVWTELGYPLLALRRLERGRVAAFASDGGEEHAPAWAAPAALESWDAVLAALLPRDPGDERLFVSREGSGASLWWRSRTTAASPPRAAVLGPDGTQAPVTFVEVYPGIWRTGHVPLRHGSFQVAASAAGVAEQTRSFPVRAAMSTPAPPRADFTRFAPQPPPARAAAAVPAGLLILLSAAAFLAYEFTREEEGP